MAGHALVSQFLVAAAVSGFAVLAVASLVVRFTSQPVERQLVIRLSFLISLTMPLLQSAPGMPRFAISWPWSTPAAAPRVASPAPRLSTSDETLAAPEAMTQRLTIETLPPGESSSGSALDSRVPLAPHDDVAAAPPAVSDGARPIPIGRWAASGYLLGVALVMGWIAVGHWRLARLVADSQPAPSHVRAAFRALAGSAGEQVRLLTSHRATAPLVCGWRRPAIVLPADGNFLNDASALRFCLAHEWSHIERRDLAAWRLALLAQCVLYYQPCFWWLKRQLRLAQDNLADARAAAQAPSELDYAEYLVRLARLRVYGGCGPALGFGGRRSELFRRVSVLTSGRQLASRPRRAWNLGLTITAAVLLAAAAGLTVGSPPEIPPQPRGQVARLGIDWLTHGNQIAAVACTPDGRYAASLGLDWVKVWDLHSGRRLHALRHPGTSGSLAFSPDGKFLAAGNEFRAARVWNVATGELKHLLKLHKYADRTGRRGATQVPVCFASDGRSICTGGCEGVVQEWDLETGRELFTHRLAAPGANDRDVTSLNISPDGKLLACACGLTISLVPLGRDEPQDSFPVNISILESLRFVANGEGLLWMGREAPVAKGERPAEGIFMHDLAAKQTRMIFRGGVGRDPVNCAILPDGTRLLTCGETRSLKIRDLASGEVQAVFAEHLSVPWRMAVTPDGATAVTADGDSLRVWDVANQTERLPPGRDVLPPVAAVAWSADGQHVLTACADQRVRRWNPTTGQLVETLPPGADKPKAPPEQTALSPDGRWLATGRGPTVELCELATGQRRTLQGFRDPEDETRFRRGRMTAIRFARDCQSVAALVHPRTEGQSPSLRAWDCATGARRGEIQWLADPQSAPGQFSLSTNGRHVAELRRAPRRLPGGAIDPRLTTVTARITDLATGELLREFSAERLYSSPEFTSDDSQLLTTYGDGVHVWDAESGEHRFWVKGAGKANSLNQVASTSDGRRIAAWTSDFDDPAGGAIEVWDFATGRVTHVFRVPAHDVAFSPDGNRLAAGLTDHTCVVYDLTSPESDLQTQIAVTLEEIVDAWRTLGGGYVLAAGNYRADSARDLLVAGGDQTVRFLSNRLLLPREVEEVEMDELVDRLAADDPQTRRAAAAIIAELSDGYWARLRAIDVATQKVPYSARRGMHNELRGGVWSRRSSAPGLLARIGTPAARELLRKMSTPAGPGRAEEVQAKIAARELANLEKLRSPD